VGDVQRHTFHPDNDVDRVTLQVKDGRRYAVYTCGNPYAEGTPVPTTTPFTETIPACLPLIPGVDTVLIALGPTGNCNPSSCQSDDAAPGSGRLNSRLEFEALVDGEVVVTIYNKGLFGPSQEYYLLATELGAAPNTPGPPLPTPYLSPTPTATFTPAPPASATPAAALLAPKHMAGAYLAPSPVPRLRLGLAALLPPSPTVPFGAGPGDGVIQFTLLLKLSGASP